MDKNSGLKVRARNLSHGVKEQIVRTYIFSLYEIAVFDEDLQENVTVSADGKIMAEHLLEQDEWKKYRVEIEEEMRKHETYH